MSVEIGGIGRKILRRLFIMKDSNFRKELKQILPLVLSYAADFYKLQESKNPNKVLDKIGWKNFANKCHEGFNFP